MVNLENNRFIEKIQINFIVRFVYDFGGQFLKQIMLFRDFFQCLEAYA